MCTAAVYKTDDMYFGRTLDYESSYGEEIAVMPRRFELRIYDGSASAEQIAMIGTAHIADSYPL